MAVKSSEKTRLGFGRVSLAALSVALGMGVGGVAAAQDDPAAEEEEIVVTGFRRSLATSIENKREETAIVDSISAEDIGDFPDLNLAESLQRVPGVQIDRDGGEGRSINVRGLSADFVRVQLNGMEALATTGGRDGRANRNRQFDFNVFASELFNSVTVRKSQEATVDEGSLGATVGLRTARPFDFDGFEMAFGGSGSYNDLAGETSLHGPWEDCPHNPILRTWSAREKWWSRGHATMIDGPDGGWHLVYHGYENGFWTLGRQTLLEPAEWTGDGWFRPLGGDLSRPLRKPLPRASADHGAPLSDDFSTDRLGVQWAFYDPGANEAARLRRGAFGLGMRGKGTNPGDCSPLAFICGDLSYEIETEIEVDEGAEAGVLLFYNRRLYAGLGFDAGGLVMHRYGLQRRGAAPPGDNARRLFLRLRNDRNIVSIHHSRDGVNWTRYGVQMEVSGYHHNTVGDFLSLRPAIYTAGSGEARFRRVTYRAL